APTQLLRAQAAGRWNKQVLFSSTYSPPMMNLLNGKQSDSVDVPTRWITVCYGAEPFPRGQDHALRHPRERASCRLSWIAQSSARDDSFFPVDAQMDRMAIAFCAEVIGLASAIAGFDVTI